MADQEIIFVVEESPEGGYEARAPGYSIFTEGANLEELRKMVRDAVACHFDDSANKPSLIRLHLVKDEVSPPRKRREEIKIADEPRRGDTICGLLRTLFARCQRASRSFAKLPAG